MVHFFDTEQAPEYGGLCYIQGADFGEWDPIDDMIKDLIQIFMVNKISCGNLRMPVKY